MEIKKREIIVSVAIIAVMFVLGFLISGKIVDSQNDKNAEYNKAIHVNNTELFQYGMDTSAGNAFVYGELKAVDTVSLDEINGEYMYIQKVEEHYNAHTRRVAHRSGKHTYHTTQVYYTWDYHDSEDWHSEKISFCGIEFDYGKIDIPDSYHLQTINESSRVRYKYYVVDTLHTGTIYTKLFDDTISDNSKFFKDMNAEESLEQCTNTNNCWNIVFWVFWVALTIGFVIGFCYFENRWLD